MFPTLQQALPASYAATGHWLALGLAAAAALVPQGLVPHAVDAHHPVLAGEHLLKVLEGDTGVTNDRLAHAVKPVGTKVALRSLRVAAVG